MTRELFHRELTRLQDEVLVMGSMVEKAILDSLQALRDGDAGSSQRIVDEDSRINAKRFEIEDQCIFVVASQQPMASDLRMLASILYIITDLERIADHAPGSMSAVLLARATFAPLLPSEAWAPKRRPGACVTSSSPS